MENAKWGSSLDLDRWELDDEDDDELDVLVDAVSEDAASLDEGSADELICTP